MATVLTTTAQDKPLWLRFPAISPDGQLIAFSYKGDLFTVPVGGGLAHQLTTNAAYDACPVWSPDGTKIAWLSMERDGYEADKTRLMVADVIFKESPDGQAGNPSVLNIKDLTSSFKYNAAGPLWSADSKGIYFNALVEIGRAHV